MSIEQLTEPLLLGEGPHWDAEKGLLYFVDINDMSVHSYQPGSKQHNRVKLNDTVGFVIPVEGGTGQEFVIGYGRDICLLKWDGQSKEEYKLTKLYSLEANKTGNRINDGKADINGNCWLGTMYKLFPGQQSEDKRPHEGSLYCMSRDGKLETIATQIGISNGLAWNKANNKMFYIDSFTKRVDVFDYDLTTGTAKNRRCFFDFVKNNVPGMPDGMAVDKDDNLWIACWSGNQVIQVSPDASLLRSVKMPAERVTSVAWGGDNLDILYVTTMSSGLSETQLKEQPLAGAVFAVTGLGTAGPPGGGRRASSKFLKLSAV